MANPLAVIDMADAIGANGPRAVKGYKAAAVYITGTGVVPWSAAQIAALAGEGVKYVLRIDQANQSGNAFLSVKQLVVDCEAGAASVFDGSHIAVVRARAGLETILYASPGVDLPGLEAAVNAAGIQAHVWYWVADWSLDRLGAIGYLEQHPRAAAVQYGNRGDIDVSVVRASVLGALPAKKPVVKKVVVPVKKVVAVAKKVHPKTAAAGAGGTLAALIVTYLKAHGVVLSPVETAEIPVVLAALGAILAPSPKA